MYINTSLTMVVIILLCFFLSQLHIGAANGYDEVVEYLLDSGADIDAVDNDGWEPIHAAACWGQVLYIER